MKKSHVIVHLVLVMLVFSGVSARAQSLASVSGIVFGPDGQPAAKIKIELIHPAHQKIFRAFSDKNGRYSFHSLVPGTYELRVAEKGMVPLHIREIRVAAAQALTINLHLKKRPQTEEKQKTADAIYSEQVRISRNRPAGKRALLYTGAEPPAPVYGRHNTEEYQRIYENRYFNAVQDPLSTFSIDVDTAAYANVRRFLNRQRLPAADVVRIEELINYFNYDYPEPRGRHPFSVTGEIDRCPWNRKHKLMHIGIQGKRMSRDAAGASNLVFLIDVSGSMGSANKLPLLIRSFKLLTGELTARDRVAIVVYAGAAGTALPSTSGDRKEKILAALNRLRSGGSTAGGAGIRLAYKIAGDNLIKNGNNRIILATDGDFNVGISSTSEMVRLIENQRDKGIFLTVLGFGRGNYKDYRLEQLADRGNGNYHYIDSILEGKKVFVNDMLGTLFTIAKDVKIQVEFNPAKVKGYRLVGYENRVLDNRDFNDDTRDAGELGAGHSVTALYEIIPAGSDEKVPRTDSLKYQRPRSNRSSRSSSEWATVKFRYKKLNAKTSILLEKTIKSNKKPVSADFIFAAAVAEWGLLLRDSSFKGQASYDQVLQLARRGRSRDPFGYREEFVRLVETAKLLHRTGSNTKNIE